MSSQHKKITELIVKELRNQLEERDMDTTGKKADLVERLKNALQEEGQDPETYLFEDKHAAVISSISKVSSDVSKVSSDVSKVSTDITSLESKVSSEISQVSTDITSLENKVSTEITSLEKKVSSEISQVSSDVLKVSTDIASLEKKVSGDISSLESKMTNEISANISKVTSDFDDKISSIKSTFEEKIKEIEKKLEETEKVDKVVEPILTDIKDDETKYKLEPRSIVEGSVGHARVKVPNFDGKSSWNNYMKQFESAARANGWSEKEKAVNLTIALRGDALDVLQTIAVEETDDFEQLKKRLNMRYGHEHLEHVYQSQFKNRRQKKDEALQEYEVDIARLVRYAYPTAPEDMMEKLAVQTFIDGLRDHEMQRTLRLARHKTLVDVLSAALEYESATQASGGYSKVRTVKEEEDEDKLDQLVNMVKGFTSKKTKTMNCCNCGEKGYARSLRKNANQETHQQEIRERTDPRGAASTQNSSKDHLILIASLKCREDNVYVDGEINGKKYTLLVDTGATRTIIRPSVINSRKKLLPTRLRLRTATGENANIHGEIQIQLGIGAEKFVHTVIVADIEEDVILGMDVMNLHGFQLDFKNRVIKVGNEEVFLHPHDDSTMLAAIREDTVVPARSETIIVARLQGIVEEGTPVMMEPWNHDEEVGRGIIIGKELVTSAKEIPVRLINVNDYPVTIKKETKVGTCVPVTSIIRQTTTSDNSNDKFDQMVAVAGQSLNQVEKRKLREFLRQYRDIFVPKGGKTGRTTVVKHKIDTGTARPIRQTARRLPQAKREEAERIVQEMKKDGVIETSTSPWVSPVVLVKKKDGTTRFCVDYRLLNNVTKKDSYPLPRIDDTLDTLAGSKLFSTLDLKSGYWQVEMDPVDKEKTAFTTGSGLWEFNVMPFGLCNAPATFERLMENVLRGLSWKTCLVYLDDIIVLGETFEDHLKNLEDVFNRLKAAQLMLNPKKCQLFQSKVNYLGHIVSKEGVAVDKGKIDSIKEWPEPTDKHQVRSFLGLCTYYRRFIKKFADIAKPLTRLTEEARDYCWDGDCQTAFETLKRHLITAPILGYPLPEGEFILDTDASNVGIGGVLSQIQGGQERVLGYFSKVLSKPERNYCVTRRELLAVVKSVEHFYQYLYGRKFLIRTDHAALKWLMQFKNPEGQIARWIERLQEYDFKIEHRAGVSHRNADSLSRRPCPAECSHCNKTESKEAAVLRTTVVNDEWTPTKIKEEQEKDPVLQKIRKWKEENRRPSWQEISSLGSVVKTYWAQWDSFILEDSLLKRVIENDDGSVRRTQLVIPKSRVAEVLRQLHDSPSGGHFGVKKTLQRIRERFYWMNSSDDVKDWCKKCTTCATSNGPYRKRKAPMRQYNVGSPFERIALDIAGPFPESDNGCKYMLVVMDYFTKWVEIYAIPDQKAATIADVLIKDCISRFGVPLEIHSDQGRNFESDLFQGICDKLGMKKTRTTAYHPQSDGMVERMNRTVGKYLTKMVSNHQRDWDQYLPFFAMAYRSAVNESTGQTPAKVLFGREMRLPCDLEFGCRPGEDVAGEDYVNELRRRMDDIHELVRSNLQIASDRMKKRYDTQAEKGCFRENDKVWLYNPKKRTGCSPKLQQFWEGPYLIVKKINDVIYRISKIPRGKPMIVHHNRLAPYEGDHDVDEEVEVNQVREIPDLTFEEFMGAYGGTGKARHGVTTEEKRDLLALPDDYSLAHTIPASIKDARGLASAFRRKFGRVAELQCQLPAPGKALKLQDASRYLFYLVTKDTVHDQPTYQDVWDALIQLREHVLESDVQKLAMPKLECSQLDWRVIRNMVEEIFQDTEVQVLVCCNPHSYWCGEKTVPCHFYTTGSCKRGSSCRYQHPVPVPTRFQEEPSFKEGAM